MYYNYLTILCSSILPVKERSIFVIKTKHNKSSTYVLFISRDRFSIQNKSSKTSYLIIIYGY